MEILRHLFSSRDFMPHGVCYLWNPGLVWLHLVSDTLIALSYLSIPVTLIYFIRKRRDMPFHWMFICFGTFIVACGATHVMEIWNIWHADYWFAGAVKAVTALASVSIAILLVQLVPMALAVPGLEQLNQALFKQTDDLARANAELAATNKALLRSEDRSRLLFDKLHVLIIEDSELDSALLLRTLRQSGYELVDKRVETANDLQNALRERQWDCIISDFSMPGFSGISALKMVREKDSNVPFIFVSGTIGEDIAVDAMRTGAQDYVLKGNLARLLPAIDR